MKKTVWSVCVGKKGGVDIYRVVWRDADGHYYVKWNKKLINVDADFEAHNFTYTVYVKAF